MKYFRMIAILLAFGLLYGCAQFRYFDKSFSDSNEALEYQQELHSNIIREISPKLETSYESALVVIPDKVAISDKIIKNSRLADPDSINYVATSSYSDLELFRKVIVKRNLFKTVDFVSNVAPEKYAVDNQKKYTATIYYRSISFSEQGWFIVTPNMTSGKEIKFSNSSKDFTSIYLEHLHSLEGILVKETENY